VIFFGAALIAVAAGWFFYKVYVAYTSAGGTDFAMPIYDAAMYPPMMLDRARDDLFHLDLHRVLGRCDVVGGRPAVGDRTNAPAHRRQAVFAQVSALVSPFVPYAARGDVRGQIVSESVGPGGRTEHVHELQRVIHYRFAAHADPQLVVAQSPGLDGVGITVGKSLAGQQSLLHPPRPPTVNAAFVAAGLYLTLTALEMIYSIWIYVGIWVAATLLAVGLLWVTEQMGDKPL
jgi:hypothetical protein